MTSLKPWENIIVASPTSMQKNLVMIMVIVAVAIVDVAHGTHFDGISRRGGLAHSVNERVPLEVC